MKTLTPKQVNDYIKKNWETKTIGDIAKALGKSESTLTRMALKLGLPKKSSIAKQTVLSEVKDTLKEDVFKLILKGKRRFSYEELADKFDVSPKRIRDIISTLENEEKNFRYSPGGVEVTDVIEKSFSTIDAKHLVGEKIRFGFVTDNHLGSKYERLDVLNALYDRFAMEGIETVYNAGNVIDGEARFNKFDIHVYGMENQCKYFAEVYPKREGIKTYYITGDDHEGWYVQREGINIGKFMEQKAREAGRDDLVYLGHMEHDVILKAKKGEAILRVVHPGGGSSYAYSYTSQKIVESYSPGEKPHIVLGGHYHKASYNYIRGVHFVQGGCTMDQSPFMRKKRLEAHIGGWIIEIQQGVNGVIQSFKCEWIPFYSKDFYDKEGLWSYQY